MQDNKKIYIGFILIIIILVAIIIFLILNNEDKPSNTTTGKNAVDRENVVVIDVPTNSTFEKHDKYANLTNEEINSLLAERTVDNVSISIKEGSLTKEKAIIDIVDKNDLPYTYYDCYYTIEKLDNNEWKELNKSGMYTMTNTKNETDKNGHLSMFINWKDRYGELESGHYRLNYEIKQDDSTVASIPIEFDI